MVILQSSIKKIYMNAKTSHDSFRSRHVVEKNKRAMIFVAIYFVYFISPVLFPQSPLG